MKLYLFFLFVFFQTVSALAKRNPFDLASLTEAMKDPAFAEGVDLFLANRFADLGSICEGRLTLQSGTPYAIGYTVSDATTIYFTPFTGSAIALYTGTRWQLLNFTETSLTPTLSASQVYDVFGYNNSGTLALELSAAWSSRTVRSEALTTIGGVHLKSSNTTRRYLGTLATDASGRIDDNWLSRGVWNQCNRRRADVFISNGGFWNYDGGYRYSFGSSVSKIDVVVGLTSAYDIKTQFSRYYPSTGAGYGGIGLNSTTVPITETSSYEPNQISVTSAMVMSVLTQGAHSFNMIESTNSTGEIYGLGQKIAGWLEN